MSVYTVENSEVGLFHFLDTSAIPQGLFPMAEYLCGTFLIGIVPFWYLMYFFGTQSTYFVPLVPIWYLKYIFGN